MASTGKHIFCLRQTDSHNLHVYNTGLKGPVAGGGGGGRLHKAASNHYYAPLYLPACRHLALPISSRRFQVIIPFPKQRGQTYQARRAMGMRQRHRQEHELFTWLARPGRQAGRARRNRVGGSNLLLCLLCPAISDGLLLLLLLIPSPLPLSPSRAPPLRQSCAQRARAY